MFASFKASLPSVKTTGKTLMAIGGAIVLVAGGTLLVRRYGSSAADVAGTVVDAASTAGEQVVGG